MITIKCKFSSSSLIWTCCFCDCISSLDSIFHTVNNIWLNIVPKVKNIENNLKVDLALCEDLYLNDENIIIMRLYEVGLLCDMNPWISSSKNDCLVFCGDYHANVLQDILTSMNFKIMVN